MRSGPERSEGRASRRAVGRKRRASGSEHEVSDLRTPAPLDTAASRALLLPPVLGRHEPHIRPGADVLPQRLNWLRLTDRLPVDKTPIKKPVIQINKSKAAFGAAFAALPLLTIASFVTKHIILGVVFILLFLLTAAIIKGLAGSDQSAS